jgi:hypothetical protein
MSAPPERSNLAALLRALADPTRLMVLVWALFAVVFFSGPLDYFRQPRMATWAWIGIGVGLFAASALAAGRLPARWFAVDEPETVPSERIERLVLITAVLGLAGAALIALDKVWLSGLDYSRGLAAVRFQRAAEIEAGIDVRRSPLLYVGYLTFSFSYAAALLYILRGEVVRRPIVAAAAEVSVASPVVYSLLYGGRNPILLFFVLLMGGILVRARRGRSLLPAVPALRLKLAVVVLLFLAYVNYTWEDRRSYWKIETYPRFVEIAHERWQTRPKSWVDRAVSGHWAPAGLVMNLISSDLYLTHSVITFDKIVERHGDFARCWGLYQVGLLAPLVNKAPAGSALLRQMYRQLRATETYGWFPTAWGAWYIDFGLGGAVGAVVAWGMASGWAHRLVRLRDDLAGELLLSFALATVVFSPINAVFGMANNILIFGSLVATALACRLGGPRLVLRSAHAAC